MPRVNNIHLKTGATLIVALVLLSLDLPRLNPDLEKKMHTAIETAFEIQEYTVESILISPEIDGELALDLSSDHFFAIKNSEEAIIGFAYLGQAPSMKNIFDYLVILDPDLSVKKAKVLIYREDYGRQIGSQRWLKQFIGLSADDQPKYGENIDAISGATISAKSMTIAVNEVLEALHHLSKQKVI